MAERSTEWAYSNDGRIAFVFLGLAIVLLAIGLLAVTAFGSDAANGGVALLAIAMFLLVFSVLVFVPRIARRGREGRPGGDRGVRADAPGGRREVSVRPSASDRDGGGDPGALPNRGHSASGGRGGRPRMDRDRGVVCVARRRRGSGSTKEGHGAPRRRIAARRMRDPTSPCRASRPCHPFRPSHRGRARRLPAAGEATSSRR